MTSLRHQSLNLIRLRLEIPAVYAQEPIFSRLISEFKLVVNITEANLSRDAVVSDCDIEIRGTAQQLHQGLGYLRSLNIRMMGKPNPAEEDWY